MTDEIFLELIKIYSENIKEVQYDRMQNTP
jgi:hypothetical protein